MATDRVSAVILAIDDAARMRSVRPKPLHLLCGRPMVQFVIDALPATLVDRIVVVVGDGADAVAKKLSDTTADPRVTVVEQPARRGSADAVLVGLEALDDRDDLDDEDVVVLGADTPLLGADEIGGLVARHRSGGAVATLLVVHSGAAAADGAVVAKRDGTVARILGDDDPAVAGSEERSGDGRSDAGEVLGAQVGVWCFRRSLLTPALRRVRPDVRTGRVHLGGVAEVLSSTGNPVLPAAAAAPDDLVRVADRVQLSDAEAVIRRRTNERWMLAGVTMVDPMRTHVDVTVALAPDVTLLPGVLLQGHTVVGPGAEIGPDTRLVDCAVGAGAVVEKTMGRDAEIGEHARVGPFAVLEPGAQVPAASRTGPFYHATTDEPRPGGS